MMIIKRWTPPQRMRRQRPWIRWSKIATKVWWLRLPMTLTRLTLPEEVQSHWLQLLRFHPMIIIQHRENLLSRISLSLTSAVLTFQCAALKLGCLNMIKSSIRTLQCSNQMPISNQRNKYKIRPLKIKKQKHQNRRLLPPWQPIWIQHWIMISLHQLHMSTSSELKCARTSSSTANANMVMR